MDRRFWRGCRRYGEGGNLICGDCRLSEDLVDLVEVSGEVFPVPMESIGSG